METFAEILKQLRTEHKLSLRELADKLDMSFSVIGMYEQGRRKPSFVALETIADYFNVDTDYLLGRSSFRNKYIITSKTTSVNIPLYSSISCGYGMFVEDNIEDYVAVPYKYLNRNKDYFANIANGDSMVGKGINEGDVLIFEKTESLDNGEIGCFCIDDNEAVCKVFRRMSDNLILLESANEKYDPIIVDNATSNFRIIGKLRFKLQQVQ